MPYPRSDITGQKFGRLTVIGFHSINRHRKQKVRCFCQCGKEHIATVSNLKYGSVRSCGCLRIKIRAEIRSRRWRIRCGH